MLQAFQRLDTWKFVDLYSQAFQTVLKQHNKENQMCVRSIDRSGTPDISSQLG